MFSHADESASFVKGVVGGFGAEAEACVPGGAIGGGAEFDFEGRGFLERDGELLEGEAFAVSGIEVVAKFVEGDFGPMNDGEVSGVIFSSGELGRFLFTPLFLAFSFGLVFPPFAGSFFFDVGPDLEEFRFELGEFFGVLFAEVVFFFPVGLDLVELEIFEGLVGDDFPVADAHRGVAFGGGNVGAPEEGDGAIDGLAGAGGEDIDTIDGAIGGDGDVGDGEGGGEEVGADDGDVAGGAGLDVGGEADDSRDTDAALVAIALAAAESAGGAPGAVLLGLGCGELSFAVALGAVVGGEDDEGVFAETEFIEGRHELAEGVVELGDIPVVLADAGVLDIGVGFLKLGVALDGEMRFVGPDGDEEGLGGVALFLEPAVGFMGDEGSREAFERADFFAITDEVFWVLVAG